MSKKTGYSKPKGGKKPTPKKTGKSSYSKKY